MCLSTTTQRQDILLFLAVVRHDRGSCETKKIRSKKVLVGDHCSTSSVVLVLDALFDLLDGIFV